jgi:hypothetical protein
MAKIALLTQRITPEALGLARALKFHRHDVLLITSAMEAVPDDLGYQVLTYFKSWSAFEALRFFPRILGQAPDVWHFVFSDTASEKPTSAHWVLAQLARALPGRVIASSFYDSLFEMSSARVAPFLRTCDIVTTATRENLMLVKRKGWLHRFSETEVLPPFVIPGSARMEKSLDQDLHQLIEAATPFLVLPSEHLPNLDWSSILSKVQLIVCGPRPDRSPDGVFYIGRGVPESEMHGILDRSLGLLTAFDEYSVVELLKYQRLCSETKTPILASPRQAEALPGLCVHKRNGFWIQEPSQLYQLLLDNPRLDIQSPLFESVKTDLADSALNELNRLYSKIRHLKTSQAQFKRNPLP